MLNQRKGRFGIVAVFILFFTFVSDAHEGLQPTTPAKTREFINSDQVADYYFEKPISSLPTQTEFQFTKTLNILIQPGAQRTKMFSDGAFSCEIFSEQKSQDQLRVSKPKIVKGITVTPYDENRNCLKTKIPIPENLDADSFDGHCQIEEHFVINITPKCYQALQSHDSGNPLFTTEVFKTSENPRLFALSGLSERMKIACRKDTQIIDVDFEGDIDLRCYDSWGVTYLSDFVRRVELSFGLKIKVPLPNNLKDVELKTPASPNVAI